MTFKESKEYEAFLIDSVKSRQEKSQHPYAIAQLVPSDMGYAKALAEATGLEVEPGEETMIGGVRLLSQSRSKMLELTLSAGLQRARQEFAEELGIQED